MKTWLMSFDMNFPNRVLPTSWKLQSYADCASTHRSKRSGCFTDDLSTKITYNKENKNDWHELSKMENN